MEFGDVTTAGKMRDVIERLAMKVINRERPENRIGSVHHFDSVRQLAWIQFPGDDEGNLVQVRTALNMRPRFSIQDNGVENCDVVRVAGKPGSYFIIDYLRGAPSVNALDLPVGSVIEWPAQAGAAIPYGYLEANGQAVSRTEWDELYAVYGTTHGAGDGSTTFNVYNRKGRVAVGQDTSDAYFNTIGEKAGESTHTLNINEIPAHAHSGTTNTSSEPYPWTHASVPSAYYSGVGYGLTTASAYATRVMIWNNSYIPGHAHSFTTNNIGGGGAHNNLQPYIVTRFLIKARSW